jgi:hypothetical protein
MRYLVGVGAERGKCQPPISGWNVNGSTLMGEKMYSPPKVEGKKLKMVVRSASPGRMVERPKPSMMPGIVVKGELELLSDHCRSRENCAQVADHGQ